jgi:hypothetical protein
MRAIRLWNVLKTHSKTLLYIGIFLGCFYLSTQYGFAAEEALLSETDAAKVTKILNGIITGAAALMGMVTSFITIFLYPGWINGTWFGLDIYLKEIWILISNVVYFVFAFILIAIAFMNIINKWDGVWELKQAMPKFIIGVLIVPFSWFFVQFMLSISSILTVGVLTLPYDSFSSFPLYDKALENEIFSWEAICVDVVISFNGEFPDGTQSLSSEGNSEMDEYIKCESKESKVSVREILTGIDESGKISAKGAAIQNSIYGIINIYSYGILRIHELDTINQADLQAISTIADLIFKIVFDLLFIVVYLILMVALLLALFARGIRLWIYAMLSPVFGLLYFFGKASEWVGEDQKFSVKEFIALALVPVYVSAALAFGLTFILVASQGIKETQEAEGDVDTLRAWGFSLSLVGAHGDGGVEWFSVIGKLIVEIFGVAILWIAVMAALRHSETTKQITSPIAEFGKSVGQLAAKAPTYAPIIPTPGGGSGLSAAGLQSLWATIAGSAESSAKQRGTDFAQWLTNPSEATKQYQNANNVAITTPANSAAEVRKILWIWDSDKLSNDQNWLEALSKHLNNMKTDSKFWFTDQAKADELIQALEWAKWNPSEVRRILSELDRLAQSPSNSILWGSTPVTTSQVDNHMWSNINNTTNNTTIDNNFTLATANPEDFFTDEPTPKLVSSQMDALKNDLGRDNLIVANESSIRSMLQSKKSTLTDDQLDQIIEALELV